MQQGNSKGKIQTQIKLNHAQSELIIAYTQRMPSKTFINYAKSVAAAAFSVYVCVCVCPCLCVCLRQMPPLITEPKPKQSTVSP